MQAKALKQRKILSMECVCPTTFWLTEERCNTQLERASRKIADWHNKLRQAAEPGRTQAEKEEKKKKGKSCSCSCLRHHRNDCHMGSQSCLQVSSPGSHPRKSSSLYVRKIQFLYHPLHSWCSSALQWSGETLAGGLHLTAFSPPLCCHSLLHISHRYMY